MQHPSRSRSLFAPPLVCLSAISLLSACGWQPPEPAIGDVVVGCVDVDPAELSCATEPRLCNHPRRVMGVGVDDGHVFRVVIVPEGFRDDEMAAFNERAERLVIELMALPGGIVARAPELFRFVVVTAPSATGETEDGDRTDTLLGACLTSDALDASGTPLLAIDDSRARFVARMHEGSPDVVVVVARGTIARANAGLPGGSGTVDFDFDDEGAAVITLGAPIDNLPVPVRVQTLDSAAVVDHELGHALIGLGDEYSDVEQCASDRDELRLPENLTLDPDGARWRALVADFPREGGARFGCGIFHPTSRCRMLNDLDDVYCPVCAAAIDRALRGRRFGDDGTPRCRAERGRFDDVDSVRVAVDDADIPVTVELRQGGRLVANATSFDPRGLFAAPIQNAAVDVVCRDRHGHEQRFTIP